MILKIFKDLTEKKLKKEYQIRCSYKYEYKKLNIICFIITIIYDFFIFFKN